MKPLVKVVMALRRIAKLIRSKSRNQLSKPELFVTIMVTSLCWFALNYLLFYSTNLNSVNSGTNRDYRELPNGVEKNDAFANKDKTHKENFRIERRALREEHNQEADIRREKVANKVLDKIAHKNEIKDKVALDALKRWRLRQQSDVKDGMEDGVKDGVKDGGRKGSKQRKGRKVFRKMIDKVKQKQGPQQQQKKQGQNSGVPQLKYRVVRDYNNRTLPHQPNSPGEMGQPVRSDPFEQKEVKKGWELASFNDHVSSKISLERSLKDVRHRSCRSIAYPYGDLPKVSVIICFTEESWTALLRSVHSVINRSPPELLEEVILVDDFSQRDYLKDPLSKYLKEHFGDKVKILRLEKREGLVRARMRGVEVAKGPVLTFLDSHIECSVGWLEPLLMEIRKNKLAVVAPIIDTIKSDTFEYIGIPDSARGGFDWTLQFKWIPVPEYEARRRRRSADPIRTPTIAGGLFAIRKDYFLRLGQYDPGLEIWGAENLEISFKVWMCYGILEIIPCSHVGHVFRKTQPYKFPKGNVETFLRNNVRIAEVWLDNYKEIYYNMRPDLRGMDYGDISDQKMLRQQLGCRNFQWYLENVYPELTVPSEKVHAKGAVHNLGTGQCLDSMGGENVAIFPCHENTGMSQYFRLTWDGNLEVGSECIGRSWGRIHAMDCKSINVIKWSHFKGGRLYDPVNDSCLQILLGSKSALSLGSCNVRDKTQKWQFEMYYMKNGNPHL